MHADTIGPLDPAPMPVFLPFRRGGVNSYARREAGWVLGNRPTRLALEIAENDNGVIEVTELDPATGEVVTEDAA